MQQNCGYTSLDFTRSPRRASSGGLEFDHRLVFHQRLHRHVSGFSSAQDTIDVGCRLAKNVGTLDPVRHQAAGRDEVTGRVDRRQAVSCRKCDDEIAMHDRRVIRHHEQAPFGAQGDQLDRERRDSGLRRPYEVVKGGSSWYWPRAPRAQAAEVPPKLYGNLSTRLDPRSETTLPHVVAPPRSLTNYAAPCSTEAGLS